MRLWSFWKRAFVLLLIIAVCYQLKQNWTVHHEDLSKSNAASTKPLIILKSNVTKDKINSPPKEEKSIHVHYYRRPVSVSLQAFARCDHKCHMTDGDTVNNDSAATIVHGPYITSGWKVPKKPPGQIWVFQAMEPPIGVQGILQKWRGLFNWTMTHRRDSDIFSPYGSFMKTPKNQNVKLSPLKWESKDRQAAWFVSHCQTAGKRELYTEQLAKKVDIHIYGGCGKYKCSRAQESSCISELKQHYKYYLAFENSFCDGYITEKPFKMYWNDLYTIPITRGLTERYDMFLPPGSFLNTDDFPSIEKLGEEMNAISRNKSRFESFFNWRKYYITEEIDLFYCDLCRMLHYPEKYRRLYDNIENWVIGHPDRRACRDPKDIK